MCVCVCVCVFLVTACVQLPFSPTHPHSHRCLRWNSSLIAFILFFFHRHAQNASFVAACPKNMHTVLRPRTKVRICHTHTLTHSLTHSHTLAPSLARTHSPSRSLTPTHSHIGVSHLLAAGAGPLPLPSVHAAVVESLGGGGPCRARVPLPSTPHQSEPWPLAGGMLGTWGQFLSLAFVHVD